MIIEVLRKLWGNMLVHLKISTVLSFFFFFWCRKNFDYWKFPCSLIEVLVPCNIMWQHVPCLLMWKLWMRTPDWSSVSRVCRPLRAMLLVGYLPCTKKLQVGKCEGLLIWAFALWICYIFIVCSADTVRKEAATIMAVFPSPNDVMSILVQARYISLSIPQFSILCFKQECSTYLHCIWFYDLLLQRVLEQRVTALLDKLLVKPSLVNLPPIEEGGLLLVGGPTRVLKFLLPIDLLYWSLCTFRVCTVP